MSASSSSQCSTRAAQPVKPVPSSTRAHADRAPHLPSSPEAQALLQQGRRGRRLSVCGLTGAMQAVFSSQGLLRSRLRQNLLCWWRRRLSEQAQVLLLVLLARPKCPAP